MNNRKVNRNTKRRLRRNKQIALLASVAVLLVCIVCGSVALLIDETADVMNTFNPGEVDIEIDEPGWKDGNAVKENVTIKNTGEVTADIRAKIVVTWQADDGSGVYAKMPVAGTDYEIVMGENTGWTGPDANGWYVYRNLAKDDSTGILIEECTPIATATPEGYHLVVDVIAEAIQAEGIPTDSTEETHPWGI